MVELFDISETSELEDESSVFSPLTASTPTINNPRAGLTFPSRNRGSTVQGSLVRDQRANSFAAPTPGPSCLALRNAVLALYRLDDFDQEYLSEGFFSDVYKVSDFTTTLDLRLDNFCKQQR